MGYNSLYYTYKYILSKLILIYFTYQTSYVRREYKIYVGVCATLFTFHAVDLSLCHPSA